MIIMSWNVNGLVSRIEKGFINFLNDENPDILCIQELKMINDHKLNYDIFKDYEYQYWNFCPYTPAYSGTSFISRIKPIDIQKNIDEIEDEDARCIIVNFDKFYLVTVYMPNAEYNLSRLDARIAWDERFSDCISSLCLEKPIIICGDLNTTLSEMDVRKTIPKTLSKKFCSETRFNILTMMKENNLIDAFRYINPDMVDAYSWWSYRKHKRNDNIGWRLDYFLISEEIIEKVISCGMHPETYGSDHCPIYLEIDI